MNIIKNILLCFWLPIVYAILLPIFLITTIVIGSYIFPGWGTLIGFGVGIAAFYNWRTGKLD